MIYYSIQLVLYWIHCRQDLSSSLWPAIEWDSAGRPRCQHLDYWSDWWIDDVSASPFFSPATTTKNRKSVFEIWFFYAPFFFCFCFVCHAWRCEVSHRIFTVSRFVLFEINITSDWNGDCDGEGCSLGLAGIDGDGLGVRKGPGGDNIPRMQKKRREKKNDYILWHDWKSILSGQYPQSIQIRVSFTSNKLSRARWRHEKFPCACVYKFRQWPIGNTPPITLTRIRAEPQQ